MIRHIAQKWMMAMALFFAVTTMAYADDWNGDWDSNFGQLRLLQNGDRLYGDYQERGVIEGKISANGRDARAVFLYNDGRWGTIQWRRSNDRISGTWAWSHEGLADPKSGKSWTATRASARTSPLKFASQTSEKYPNTDIQFQESARDWIAAVAGGGSAPQSQPQAGTRDGLSEWYGGYALRSINPAFDIGVDIIHYRGSAVAAADMTIFVNRGAACPQIMHTQFCEDLEVAAAINGSVRAMVTGTQLVQRSPSQEMHIMFRLSGDRQDRMLRIRREATYFNASIIHPTRGYDYVGTAQGRSHLCEQTGCSNDVFRDVKNNPDWYRGGYDRAYADQLANARNQIARSHQRANPAPAPLPQPQPQPQPAPGPRPLLSDAYAILDETNDNLGAISFRPNAGQLGASGTLNGFFETGEPHETEYRFVSSTGEAVSFDLTTYAGQSGERRQGRLIVELPTFARNNPKGTLIVDDEFFLVELVRPTQGLNANDVGDVPAIGIYSVNYSLRDVPLNRTVVLRKEASRSAAETGRISPTERDLTVLRCLPEINSLQFQEANWTGKTSLLSRSWCQISNTKVAGWLPGRYLAPQGN